MPYISTAEHAKSIRSDIKAALKAGTIPAGTKISVTTDRFSGGSAIRVSVVAVAESFTVYDREALAYREANPHASYWDIPHHLRERYTVEANALIANLEATVSKYHEDNSTDDGGDKCWNVNFYKTIQFNWECEKADRERAEAERAASVAQLTDALVKPAKPRVSAYLVEIKF